MPSFSDINLTPDQLRHMRSTIDSDAFAAEIITRIKNRVPTSAIRTSDGERGLIRTGQGHSKPWFLNTGGWVQRYGLDGADIEAVGRDLVWAGHNADYLACTVSGTYWKEFDTYAYFKDRTGPFISQFWPQQWEAMDRVRHVLGLGPVLVLHRDHDRVCRALEFKYGCKCQGLRLDSWRDHARLMDEVAAVQAQTVLVSGGPSGKPFCVRLAKATSKVVLDVGEALTSTWAVAAVNVADVHARNRGL